MFLNLLGITRRSEIILKDVKICTTTHERGKHKLYIDSFQLLDCKNEASLVEGAKRLGIYFRDLDHKVIQAKDREFILTTEWYGTKDTLVYLNWKGTVGPGLALRRIIKDHNDATSNS